MTMNLMFKYSIFIQNVYQIFQCFKMESSPIDAMTTELLFIISIDISRNFCCTQTFIDYTIVSS